MKVAGVREKHVSWKIAINPFYSEAIAAETQPVPEEIQEIHFQPQKTGLQLKWT